MFFRTFGAHAVVGTSLQAHTKARRFTLKNFPTKVKKITDLSILTNEVPTENDTFLHDILPPRSPHPPSGVSPNPPPEYLQTHPRRPPRGGPWRTMGRGNLVTDLHKEWDLSYKLTILGFFGKSGGSGPAFGRHGRRGCPRKYIRTFLHGGFFLRTEKMGFE